MNRFLIFVFIFLSACAPAKIFNVADPGTGDFWIQFLLRGTADHDPFLHETFREDSPRSLELDWTLLIGAVNATTRNQGFVVDQNGFIYVVGNTEGGVYNAGPIGTRDLILGKYDSKKNTVWTQQIGSAGVDLKVVNLAVDSNGNVYVTGSTDNNGFFTAALAGSEDMFVIKFNPDGTRAWTTQAGPAGPDSRTIPSGISVDTFGNSYVVGESSGPFGGPELGFNGFIVKFDSNGNQVWVRQLSIPNARIQSNGITFDKVTGNLYLAGWGNANFETDTIPGIGTEDLFILKYDCNNGNKRFFAQLGLPLRTTQSHSVAVDPFGNVFVSGESDGDFGSGADGTTALGTVVKYDSFGVRQWIRQLGPIRNRRHTSIQAMVTDTAGNVYTTGFTAGNIENESDASIGTQDVFLTKHNPSGQREWVRQFGVPGGSMFGKGIGVDLEGNLYVAGNTEDGLNGLPFRGDIDLFVVKYK
ncbi:beta-propeller repeat protein [Leptospira weilii serovar Ranarum str. ICFT]|uniref:Beta-propeller repeat protein n=1 Tax=Leptospira weilii serovar Ranarum str. ICFT TaxID=1218598 RepID=N1W7Z7_9LEPT|nr:SBBP repeat-containing protein [Leptospira weilii]EMY76356.1 beta-propeller repeat protein [Leptospira weilii serovar Ranarum str. ICFT]